MKMKDYYKKVPQGESHNKSRFEKIFSKIIKDVGASSHRILDVGAGDGVLAGELKKNNTVVCMELNKSRVKRLKERGHKVIEQDIEEKWRTKDGSFDVVIMTEVLEHCFATVHILNESYRVLKRGGRVVITTPNITSIGHRLQILLGREPSYYSHTSFEHIRIFTPTSLKIMMEKAGFVNVKTKTIVGVPVKNFGEIIYATGEKK